MSNEDDWKNMLLDVKKYIDDNKKRPSARDGEIGKLGKWISRQITIYSSNEQIMKNDNIRKEWKEFIEKYKIYFLSNEEYWKNMLLNVKIYIDENKKRPSTKDEEFGKLGNWISKQIINYNSKEQIMKNDNICKEWEEFINNVKYKKYFISAEDEWNLKLELVKKYIDENKKRPSSKHKNKEISVLGIWLVSQNQLYEINTQIMKDTEIKKKWEEFITEYQQYFPDNPAIQKPTKKSTDIKPKKESLTKETDEQRKQRKISEYQELTKKMSIQKSDNTNKMFKDKPELWEQYHEARDFSFQGYEQNEIPVNKIISYLETKKNHRLKILDLGCGRNLIKEHFKDNKKFTITGYDHISYNGSKVSDISNLEDEEEDTIDVCVYSQSLMGSNWKEYLDEGKIVLRYNGEMIISESSDRYEIIKIYLIEIGMKIIKEEYNESKRWFYINVIKQ